MKDDLKWLTKKEAERVEKSPAVRRKLAEGSFELFLRLYFSHYLTYPFWEFHREIIGQLENPELRFLGVMAFRWSWKSSLVSTAFAIWSILGRMETKYVVIFAQTQQQARQYMKSLKEELENNSFLRKDLWPFEEDESEWNNQSIVLRKFGARITVLSSDQSIRGIRHGSHRPELIIADDLENLQSVKTRESRDKLYEWFTKELIPLGDLKKTRIVILGNMLHRDSLLMRMRDEIDTGKRRGKFLRYPLVASDGKCVWPERYTDADLEDLRLSIWNETAWRTEYLLEDAGSEGQIIRPEWIGRFDFPVTGPSGPRLQSAAGDGRTRNEGSGAPYPWALVTWVDLAISESDTADYTAFVTGWIWGKGDKRTVYVVDSLARRMDFPTAMETLSAYDARMKSSYKENHEIFVEDVGFQRAFVQQSNVSRPDMAIEGAKPVWSKADRLILVSDYVRNGKVLFAKTPACDSLVEQILGFGKERHDDLVDAFSIMVQAAFVKRAPLHFSVFFG